jgi:hypothetical protein
MLQTISDMLTDYPSVQVFALNFSNAFDTVWHSTLLEKLTKLNLPDEAYDWLKYFFKKHCETGQYHCKMRSSLHPSLALGRLDYCGLWHQSL